MSTTTTAEVIGDVIHGGDTVVRVRVDNLYPHLPYGTKVRREADLIDAARAACPWAAKKLAVSYGQTNTDYDYYLTVAVPTPDRVRAAAVEERLRAAEQTRCACGSHGSWEDSVSGTSGGRPCVWAGCPTCSGSAVGRPILAADLAWYERYTGKTVAV